MPTDFAARAVAALERAEATDTVVVAVVRGSSALVIQTRSDHPHHLARLAASLAGEVAERLDRDNDALDGAEHACLLVACQDAEALLREALHDE